MSMPVLGSTIMVAIDVNRETWAYGTVVKVWKLPQVQELMPAFTASEPLVEVMIDNETWWAWPDQIRRLDLPTTHEPDAVEEWLAQE